MKKNTSSTGQISVYGVHKKADVKCLEISEAGLETEYVLQGLDSDSDEFIDLVIFSLSRLRDANTINDFELLISYSYFTTNLVHKTIAERITIDDKNKVRYMSKQNVHQNIIRKVIAHITAYIRLQMPREFEIYFPNTAKGEANANK